PLEHDEIMTDYQPGDIREVALHDGSVVRLKKIGQEYDPTDRMAAIRLLEAERAGQTFTTGLLYLNEERRTLVEQAQLVDLPLVKLRDEKLRPSRAALEAINAEFL
ncbi:MAG: 2-oxoacid:ferredoxin oxidoreductase subunit beta, partial [Trichlorobacter sp.]